MITAPHTHWGNSPVIESWCSERYAFQIGAQRGQPKLLTPYSFVFSPQGPLAHEWADESVVISNEDLDIILPRIQQINEAVVQHFGTDAIPYGIAINHRFKKIFRPPLFSASEFQCEEFENMSLIIPSEASENSNSMDPVAWPCTLPISAHLLLPRESVDLLASKLRQLPPEDAIETYDALLRFARN
jgi:hypothetical protein